MNNPNISIIVLTYNEELHLPRLLSSIQALKAKTYVLDSFSEDNTLRICMEYGLTVVQHPFFNHPTQWHHALSTFEIDTPWVICLDADQVVTPELNALLLDFNDRDFQEIEGIYFNRKNYFKGRWIRHGGYYPKYLLKMFRYSKGWSDLTENMDHRFQVTGKTVIWKTGHLLEENLKEKNIGFWIEKHNRYSTLLAEEGLKRMESKYQNSVKSNFWGSPNERNAWLKRQWWRLPLYLRPLLYFFYRLIWKLGFMDGKNGIIYHFLQGFWFRLIVDIKIDERMKNPYPSRISFIFFIPKFILLFGIFYSFNIAFIGITNPDGIYVHWLDTHLNYITFWRNMYISASSFVLEMLGYTVYRNELGLSVKDHSGFKMVYSCLGYGLISCVSAFTLVFPKPYKSKLIFLVIGISVINMLNTIRLILIALYYKTTPLTPDTNHHSLYNWVIYSTLIIITYIWINTPYSKKTSTREITLPEHQHLK